jgi:DNA-binding MarR family transcriptional regulator
MTIAEARSADTASSSAAERGQRIWLLLIDFAQSVTDAVTARLGSEDLANNNEGWVVCQLAVSGPRRPRDLMLTSGFSSPGMTRLLDRLENLGIVERAVLEVPADRRAIVISLTPEGQRVATSMGQGVEDASDRIRTVVADISALLGPVHMAAAPAKSGPPPAGAIARGQRILLDLIDLGRHAGGAVAARLSDREHVNNTDIAVVCQLAVTRPRRPRDLMLASGLSSGGMTRLLDRLEQAGIVARAVREVPADRRAIVISLTPEGRRMATDMGLAVEDARDRMRTIIADISALLDA